MQLTEEVRLGARLPRRQLARYIRVAAGVSQSRLAAELGVHRVTLARWENGTHAPRGPERARYAALLDDLQREIAA